MNDPATSATWAELMAQPAIWADWAGSPALAAARAWVATLNPAEIWLTGAGSSAYIGEMIVAGLEGQGAFPNDAPLRAIATTDIVARPRAYLAGRDGARAPLVISFGRSGNSAESIGTLDALDALAPDAPRLHITCNANSGLARRAGPNGHALILPEATHDSGFAMTSSLTTMLFSALAILDRTTDGPAAIARAATAAAARLPALAAAARAAALPPRIVFTGSGPLAFAARESALKVMELTAGHVPALWDSTLGYRHGPKSFAVPGADVILLTHPDPHTARYDADLAAELRTQFPQSRVTTLGPGGDIDLPMPDGAAWGAPLAILYAQCLAVIWSAVLGLAPDDPFAGQGTLSRVVSGVTLYPVTA